jgi:serine/threonine-protein kinase RsbW
MTLSNILIIDNEPYEVARAAEWLDHLVGDSGYNPRIIASIQIALEEVLTNILNHGYADLDPHKIEIHAIVEPSGMTLEILDDGIPFDPTRHERTAPPDDPMTAPGGLGILFVRRMMDEVTFERIDGRNHLTMRKHVA